MARIYPARSKFPLRLDTTVYSPRKAPNLRLWLTTRTASSVKAAGITAVNNDPVDTWNSLVGASSYTQSLAGQKPLLLTNSQNGLPVLSFDGSNDFMVGDATALAISKNINALTIIMAVNVVALAVGDSNIFNFTTGSSAGSSRANVTAKSTGARNITGRALDADANSNFSTASTYTANQFEILTCQWDFTGKQGRIRRNGTTEANWTSFTNMTAGNTSNTSALASNIGDLNSSTFANVKVGEILVYESKLSDADCLYVERGQGSIWGVTVA